MLSADAIDKIQDLSQSHTFEIGDVHFHQTTKAVTAIKFPTIEPFKLFSLTQLVNFIKLQIRDEPENQVLVNVLSHEAVDISHNEWNENSAIDLIGRVNFEDMFETFPFGAKLSQEDFIINVMTKFESDESTQNLIKLASMVRAEKINTSEDDGISQIAATKAGVHLTQKAPINNLWILSTFKTFPEVEQPKIPYILRLHQNSDEMPKFALYECDGGKWKVDLTIAIREWIINRLKVELADKADLVVVL